MLHPLNKQVSTISTSEIYNYAFFCVKKFVGPKLDSEVLPNFGTHVSIEDLAMDAVEKVVRANPMYITKTYIRIAARCVCIRKLQIKKLPKYIKPEEDEIPIEVEGNIEDSLRPLEDLLISSMDPLQQKIYHELLKNKMYVEIAETLGISLRTLERQVQELKWLCEYLLTEEDPDLKLRRL